MSLLVALDAYSTPVGTVLGGEAAICLVIGGTIMSSQTWDTWFFGHVHFLHQYDLAQGYQK